MSGLVLGETAAVIADIKDPFSRSDHATELDSGITDVRARLLELVRAFSSNELAEK